MKMHTYAEAAAELKVPPSWLEKNKARLPRTEFGPTHVRFSDDDLALIRQMHEIRPAVDMPVLEVPAVLADLKPYRARRRTS